VQPIDAVDGERVAADPLDPGPHGDQAAGQVGDLRLARRVDQHRGAAGQRGRHQQVLRGADRDGREHHLGAAQAMRRRGDDVALAELDLRPELGQGLQMQVDRSGADGAAARQRHPRPSAAGQQRPQYQQAGAHLAHQVVGRRGVADLAGDEVHQPAAVAVGAGEQAARRRLQVDRRAVLAQQARHRPDVGQVRQVAQAEAVFGQQAGRHQRQRRVLRPTDRDYAVEGSAPADADSVHGCPAGKDASARIVGARADAGPPRRALWPPTLARAVEAPAF
jgi:hypothetical protein